VDETVKSKMKAHIQREKPRHWRSLDERELTPAARAAGWQEFAPGASGPAELPQGGVSRRRFLGLVGATAALAATTACSKMDRGSIVPYTKRPVEVIPGVANYYASTFAEGRRVYSVLVKTREGRPIHITGNDEDPAYKGKTSPRAVADVLRLYDPDRLRAPKLDGRSATWSEVDRQVLAGLVSAKASGKTVFLMTGAVPSPSRRALIAQMKETIPSLIHMAWEPADNSGRQSAAQMAFGGPVDVKPRLDKAKVILSLGSDFLNGEDPAAIASFAAQRRPSHASDPMNRLWVVEGAMTLTGMAADHRFPVKPSKTAEVAFALAGALHGMGVPLPANVDGASLPKGSPAGFEANALDALAKDLKAAGTGALVLCGDSMPMEVHLAAHLINFMLGASGNTLEVRSTQPSASLADLQRMAEAMGSGDAAAAIFWGVNPAYAFADAQLWKGTLAKVPLKVWMGVLEDETAAQCSFVLPENHWLEAWGDYEVDDGRVTLQQPTVGALYDTRQGEETLLAWLKGLGAPVASDYHSYLRARWQKNLYPAGSPVPFERFFEAALHDGLIRREPSALPAPVMVASSLDGAAKRAPVGPSDGFELILRPGAAVYDGRYANSGWLQELPDPVTKITWGNPVSVAVADAKRLGLQDGDLVTIEASGASVHAPCVLQPGQAEGVLTLELGYGRTVGSVAAGVGVNAYPFMDASSASPNLRQGVRLSKAGGREALPITQGHHRMEGRDIVRSYTVAEYAKEAAKGEKREEPVTLYPEQQFPDHKWGMAIDLSSCVGCSGCVVACQSENNIPVVGPEQVVKGREMHWIRIDRYYEGDPGNPSVAHQPMLCQQCDDAPCENVCPVGATNHSPDGLNQMVYNRCVGTRYCANNCPYKVRRFNFLEFTAFKKDPEALVYNPEVTVRPRGVMEKCTFCVQRISDARMRAKGENRPLRDGEIVPACAAACPAEAIVFGDLKDPKSRVSELSGSDRGYKVLEELGVRPAITYLANLKNPAGGGTHEA
jgi:MoCo/4Fe-4S cofactor protein with predicted Tat translocation signal